MEEMRNMKINYDFYSGKDEYSDGEIEKDIIEYTEKYEEKDFDKIFEKDSRWPVFYHLTSLRKNILNWYPFRENAEVLEIGAGMGAITGILCEKAQNVTSVELSKQRATAIAKRCKNKENLEIIVGNFNDIKFEKKFDYITLIGVLEYAPLYTNSDNSFHDFLTYIKSLLKEDGKLLIAIENQYGIKYFSGANEDHTGKRFDGILGYERILNEDRIIVVVNIMEKEELIRNLGPNITMCFLEGCPRADKCVKHLAYKMFGDQKTHGKTVMPSSLKADGQCDQFEEAIAKRYAKGAQHIFDEVRMKHFGEIKARVVRILGGRTSYYRCMRGEKLITEEQQTQIANLFKSYGYDSGNLYDEYIESL